MDRDRLFRYLEQRYTSKRDMISRVPLDVQPDVLWQELLDQRRSRCTVLPLYSYKGIPYWYVTTEKMIAASEKIVETLFENEADPDPYEAPAVSTLEEVFYTSYVEGSQITIQAAMDFLTSGQPPRDIEEQMIANNRQAGSYAGANLYRPIDAGLMRDLAYILTDGMDEGGQDYRTSDAADFPVPEGEQFVFPSARTVPDRVNELSAFLASPLTHPLIKAAAAQAYLMILRPFPEGNERLGRVLSSMILLRAGYAFFGEVSLSALIARKSYGYYEAIANILREENGGDLTYFMDYFFELLSRAVDERQLRINRREEQARQAELEMARTALKSTIPSRPVQPEDVPSGRREWKTEPANNQPEEVITDLSGFQTVSITGIPKSGAGDTLAGAPEDWLRYYAEYHDKIIGQISAFLLQLMDAGRTVFTVGDLTTALNLIPRQLSSSIRNLKEKGIIRQDESNSRHKCYRICTEEEQKAIIYANSQVPFEERYDPAVLELIKELIGSNSPKDKRIGKRLMECIAKGEISVDDYAAIGEAAKWTVDMRFAEQLGLVERVSPQRCSILRKIKPGAPFLNKGQRKFITQIYESFGDTVFSTEMVIATLDYSGPHISAYLHQFTLLSLLDCRKEDVYRYQFLITPEEYPEFFDIAV